MLKFVVGLMQVLGAIGAVWVVGQARNAEAIVVDFEDPPYTTANIVGQDGWALTGYTGIPNGTLEVSSTDPLAGGGLQSLSYTRTELGLAGTFHDVVKSDVAVVAKDGTPAADLNVSYLISSTSLSDQGLGFGVAGVFLSHDGPGGASPIGVLLRNAGSSIPSIEVFADNGGSPAFFYFGGDLAAAAFPENDTLEFNIDVDFDSSTFTVAYRNVTAGTPFVASPNPFGFATPYTANAGGNYDVDVIAAFRYGAGRLDNITLTGNLIPEPTTAALGALGLGIVSLVRRRR